MSNSLSNGNYSSAITLRSGNCRVISLFHTYKHNVAVLIASGNCPKKPGKIPEFPATGTLCNGKTLRQLIVKDNCIWFKENADNGSSLLDEEAFVAALGANTVLRELDLQKTRIGEETSSRIFCALTVNQNLERLECQQRRLLYGAGMENIQKLSTVVLPQ